MLRHTSESVLRRHVQVFPGESELARAMRELEWTTTPLGDPDATAAFALAQQALPDVAVLDLELVGGRGSDLGARLRAMGPVASIALTGYGSEMARTRTRAAGCAQHLLEPADLQLLPRAIVNAAGGDTAPGRSP